MSGGRVPLLPDPSEAGAAASTWGVRDQPVLGPLPDPSEAGAAASTFDVQRGRASRPELMYELQLHSLQTGHKVRCMTKEDGHTPSGSKSFWVCCDSRPVGIGEDSACKVLCKCFKQKKTGLWFISPKTAEGPPVLIHLPGCTSVVKLTAAQAAAHPAMVAEQAKSEKRLSIKAVQTVLSQVGQKSASIQASQRHFAFSVAKRGFKSP
ncbi:hypothetical protein T484DRAFT_1884122 [Baffinella frigidus]|nr:hypothetical protein T484DRAFT_1884122 [Cryptophyta sp. CCMP2293]|mmetsp:Transcript_27744/g.66055  ORF Transcript_27744/g.66055 Transcript_27744/m.66055 type:complete len:208 (-) Transcript_27744:45-668(-)